jgi:predicted transglutaminase-like cysteine proteinase
MASCSTTTAIIVVLNLAILLFTNTARAGVFGSTEHQNNSLKDFPKWTEMLSRFEKEKATMEADCNVKNADVCNLKEWFTFISDQQQSQNRLKILKAVNRYINEIRYIKDIKGWGEIDYWATPYQFLTKGGDCEDFAIAKFATLKKLGFSNEEMRVVVLMNKMSNLIHSVLVVNIAGKEYLLDNEIPVVKLTNDIRHYRPIYSINETNWWRHSI